MYSKLEKIYQFFSVSQNFLLTFQCYSVTVILVEKGITLRLDFLSTPNFIPTLTPSERLYVAKEKSPLPFSFSGREENSCRQWSKNSQLFGLVRNGNGNCSLIFCGSDSQEQEENGKDIQQSRRTAVESARILQWNRWNGTL